MPLGCFSSHKGTKKLGASGLPHSPPSQPSFKSRVRAIQLAQRFIHSNPKFRCAHPGDNNESDGDQSDVHRVLVNTERNGSVTPKLDSAFVVLADHNTDFISRPMPLPSPPLSPFPSCYKLPHPPSPKVSASLQVQQYQTNPASTKMQRVAANPESLPQVSRETVAGLISFRYEELLGACDKLSPECSTVDSGSTSSYIGKIIVNDRKGDQKHIEVTVTPIYESCEQGYKQWLVELSIVARLQSSRLCKIIGFYAEEGRMMNRLLVYERLAKGRLDRLLYGRMNFPTLDWPSRMKIALGAAQGLAYLHAKNLHMVRYAVFKTSNIEVEVDFSSKLSGYGFANRSTYESVYNPSCKEMAYRAPETTNIGYLLSREANVWSFGIVLLELLTGRRNMEGGDLVKWTRPLLAEENRMFMMLDPKLQGRFPAKGSKVVGDLIGQCVEKDPSRRPTMRAAVEILKVIQLL